MFCIQLYIAFRDFETHERDTVYTSKTNIISAIVTFVSGVFFLYEENNKENTVLKKIKKQNE